MKQAAIVVPMRRERIGQLAGDYAGRLARKGLGFAVLAWAITYGGVYLGLSVLAEVQDASVSLVALLAVFVVVPMTGIALAVFGIRWSARSLQVELANISTKFTSMTALILGLSFFVIPTAVVSVISLWAFI